MLTREQKQARTYCIYFLRCPDTWAVRYIGMSSIGRVREHAHWTDRLLRPQAAPGSKEFWLQNLSASGKRPVFDAVLTGLKLEEAEQVETRLIFLHSQFRRSELMQAKVDVCRCKSSRRIGFRTRPNKELVHCADCHKPESVRAGTKPYGWGWDEERNLYCRKCAERINASLGLLEAIR
jgi:hypothetical protein